LRGSTGRLGVKGAVAAVAAGALELEPEGAALPAALADAAG
jgi:hypothetical protein